MNKLILLILSLCIFSFAKIDYQTKQKSKYGKDNYLNIEFLGSCKDFQKIDSISIKEFSSGDCLPISSNPYGSQDDEELHAKVNCKKLGEKKSLITFKRIFSSRMEFQDNFVISLKPTRPFKAISPKGKVSYVRRPFCSVVKNFCNQNELVVDSCHDVPVEKKNGYVVSKDRVYILLPNHEVRTCENNNVCCSYISSTQENGICPFVPTEEVFYIEDEESHNSNSEHDKPQNPHKNSSEDVNDDEEEKSQSETQHPITPQPEDEENSESNESEETKNSNDSKLHNPPESANLQNEENDEEEEITPNDHPNLQQIPHKNNRPPTHNLPASNHNIPGNIDHNFEKFLNQEEKK